VVEAVAMVMPTGTPGTFCVVDGVTYRSGSSSPSWAFLLLDERDPPRHGVIETGQNSRGRWAKVGWDFVERRFEVTITATLDGTDVSVLHEAAGEAVVLTWDPVLAQIRGFEGSQHDLWQGTVSLTDLVDVKERLTDHPLLGQREELFTEERQLRREQPLALTHHPVDRAAIEAELDLDARFEWRPASVRPWMLMDLRSWMHIVDGSGSPGVAG
jgi:hypothetical protein